MKGFIKNIVAQPLFSGSAVMIFGSNIANFLGYIYHLIFGRILGPALYSELAAVISLLGMFSASFTFLGLVIVKFVSGSKKEELEVLFSWFSKKGLILAAALGLLIIAVSPLLVSFLHIKYPVILLLAPTLFFSVISFVYRSFLQGIFKFLQMVTVANMEFFTRLIIGLLFVYAGLSVFGATLGLSISTFLGFALSRFYLRKFKFEGNKNASIDSKKVLSYTAPVFLATLATSSFYTTDVLLVKHFFNPYDAGLYASLSTLGKIIFYASGPVGGVMFPMVSQKHSRGEKYLKVFLLSLSIVLLITLGVLFIYWLFPVFSIRVLYGEKYLGGASNLVWFGLYMATYTIGSLFVSFFLSIGKTRIVFFPLIFAVLQILLILMYHSSIFSVISVSFFSAFLLLICLLVYFVYGQVKKS